MRARNFHQCLAVVFLSSAALLCARTTGFSATTNAVVAPDSKAVEDARNWAIVTNALQQMREEGQAAFHAAEKARQETDAGAKQSAEAIKARLSLLEQSFQDQAKRELATIESWNRFILTVGAALGGVGLLGLIFIAF